MINIPVTTVNNSIDAPIGQEVTTVMVTVQTGVPGLRIEDLATVASTGSYTDLTNKPSIPSSLSQLSSDPTHRTIADQEKVGFEHAEKTGILTLNGVITVNALDNTKIDIPSGTSKYADFSDSANPVIDFLSWPDQTLTPDSINVSRKWIGIQRSGPGTGVVVFSTGFTALQRRFISRLGRVWSNSGTSVVEGIGQYAAASWGVDQTTEDLIYADGSKNIDYNDFFTNSDLTLGKTAGKSFRYAAGPNLNCNNEHDDSSHPVIGLYHYHIGQESTGLTQVFSHIDPEYYDLNGTKTAVPSGKFTVQPFLYFPVSEVVDLIYGQKYYDTLQQAIDGISKDKIIISTANNDTIYGSILRGWLCVGQGATNLSDPAYAAIIENTGNGSGGIGASSGRAGSSPVDSVNGHVGVVVLDPDDLVDTLTSHKFTDASSISRLANTSGNNTGDQTNITGNAGTATALSAGADRTKLDGIASGAEVNVNADWNASSGDSQILNKPTIPTLSTLGLNQVNNTSDMNKPVSTAQFTSIQAAKKYSVAMAVALS